MGHPVFEDEGRLWLRGAVTQQELERFDHICQLASRPGARLSLGDSIDALIDPESTLMRQAQEILPGARPVRIVAFNKTAETNWLVPWHQDRVIAVSEKHEQSGYSSWSNKSGTWHVEPPVEILEHMIFARVHLDDNDERNGCMELALGTHQFGRVESDEAAELAETAVNEPCVAKRGDLLFVKFLTLHRSQRSKKSVNRRTLRIDFAAQSLPAPLEYAI